MRPDVEGEMSDISARDLADNGIGYNPAFLKRIREARRRAELERKAEEKRLADRARKAVKAPRDILLVASPNLSEADSIKAIITTIAAKHGLTYDDVVGTRRYKKIYLARKEAYHKVYELKPNMSLSAIARHFNKDHTSLLYALGRLKRNK